MNLFTLSRRMGTSLAMIDATYGHLAPNADELESELLDSYDSNYRSRGITMSDLFVNQDRELFDAALLTIRSS